MPLQNDASYTLVDLLMNDSFRAWVQSNGQENALFWETWMAQHPDKAYLVEEARQMLLAFELDPYRLPKDRKEILRQKVIAMPKNPDSGKGKVRSGKHTSVQRHTYWPRIAAAVLVLLTLTAILYGWLHQNDDILEYRTGYGEIKQILLPDSSRVTLNANTKLSLPARWDGQSTRKVWLEGEAYFEVERYRLADANRKNASSGDTSSHQKFNVITNNLVVEVLGTKFNVHDRHDLTKVVLNSGSVKLQMSEEEIWMEPGDYVAFSSLKKSFEKTKINPENYTAWRSGQFYFDSALVEEIKQTLEDNYGIEIIFENWQKTEGVSLRGIFPTDNLNILLQALANTTHTEMRRKGNRVFYR